MDKEIEARVVSASRQWWLKINTKPVRMSLNDGATYPYIIKVSYTVGGKEYLKRRWIKAGAAVPAVGASVRVAYDADRPEKARVLL